MVIYFDTLVWTNFKPWLRFDFDLNLWPTISNFFKGFVKAGGQICPMIKLETILVCSQSERYSLGKYLKSGSFCLSPSIEMDTGWMLKISWENVGSNIKDMSWSLVVSATCCNWQKIAQISYFLWHLTAFTVFLQHELITKCLELLGYKNMEIRM